MSNSEYNEDELVAPAWINNEFFQQVLSTAEKVEKAAVNVNSFHIEPATKKGDHYASIMFRANVQYQLNANESQSKSLIVKIMPETAGQKLKLLKDVDVFEKEIIMYSKIIPLFEQELRDIGDETKLAPSCLYYSLSPHKLLVFEDLVSQGYKAPTESITLAQAKSAYMKLAKWHAISYKINLEAPEFFEKFSQGMLNANNKTKNAFFRNGIRYFIELLDSTPTLRKYKPYFESIEPSLVDECKQTFNEYRDNPQKDAYYVLCHGDFHAKNIMLKLNTDKNDEDIMLLDFQTCIRGPIAIDIIYSLYQLIDNNLRPAHVDELVKYYFDIFTQTLKKIGFKGTMPKFVLFRAQLFQHRKWEMLVLSTLFPIWSEFRSGTIDPKLLFTSEEYNRKLYKNEKVIAELEVLLKRHEELGYFHVN